MRIQRYVVNQPTSHHTVASSMECEKLLLKWLLFGILKASTTVHHLHVLFMHARV